MRLAVKVDGLERAFGAKAVARLRTRFRMKLAMRHAHKLEEHIRQQNMRLKPPANRNATELLRLLRERSTDRGL